MLLRPLTRKITLICHSLSAVGLLGAISTFLVMAVAAFTSVSDAVRGGYHPAMVLVTLAIIVPFALVANLSGLLLALATPWGLFRHHWVSIKFWVTLFATAVLLLKLRLIMRVADCYGGQSCLLENPHHSELELVVHAAAGLLVLLVPLSLSILKPRSLTAYGKRQLGDV